MSASNGKASDTQRHDARRPPMKSPSVLTRIGSGNDILPEVDGRTLWSRRMRELIALHVSDAGGDDRISEAERSLIRRASVLTVQLEQLELGFATGNASGKTLDTYQRLTNTLRRVLQAIGLHRVPRDVTPSPLDYARGHHGTV
jgi:hypothetical protein